MDWEEQYRAAGDLVDIQAMNPNIVLDIAYATPNNFVNSIVYETPKCFLHKDAASAIDRVQRHLEFAGFGLKIWDGYRPLWAQQMLWNILPDDRYVAPPQKGGRHTRGTAVDLTLIYLSSGEELLMPTPFDDFTSNAHRDCQTLSEEILHNRQFLEDTMVTIGHFVPYFYEWWHFDLQNWQNYTPLNVSFSQLMIKNNIE